MNTLFTPIMLKFATRLLSSFTMATSQDPAPTPDEVMSNMMAVYRSRGFVDAKRNGVTMLNPYHFRHSADAAQDQQLAVSLLDQIYAAPVDDQTSLAGRLGHENDKAGPYMLWESFVTGHVEIFATLSKSFARSPGPDKLVADYTSARVKEVFNTSMEARLDAVDVWLDEFKGDESHLLFKAAVEGDEAVLRHLLQAGVEIHPDQDPSSVPLHAACHNGRLGAAQQLFNAGVSVDHADEFGGTPLMRAAAGDRADVVEWLLQNGANPHAREKGENGHTALELGMNNAKVVELLLNSDAEWTPTAFAAAVHHGHQEPFEAMKSLSGLADGKSAESRGIALDNRQREAVLFSIKHCAAKQPASGETVRWLLGQLGPKRKGDLYVLDGSDKELLQSLRNGINGAVHSDDADTARLLIRNLALSDAEQTDDSKADELNEWLLNAVFYNSASVTRMFFSEFGLDPNCVIGARFETPLTVAAIAGHVDMIKLLVSDFNANIHKANGPLANGPTALWNAIRSQKEKAARALLDLEGPVEGIHEALKGGEKRIWLVAEKQSKYRSPVNVVAWMTPLWEEDENEDVFLCLEYPQGFQGPVRVREDDAALALGDDRPLGSAASQAEDAKG